MPNLDDEAAMWDRVEFARKVAKATPPATYPGQPWEQWDIGEYRGELVTLAEPIAQWETGSVWYYFLAPDTLNMATMLPLHPDRVRRLTPAEVCAHPLTGPVIAAVAQAVGLGDSPDPTAAVPAWQETWEV